MHTTSSSLDGFIARGSHFSAGSVPVRPKIQPNYKVEHNRIRKRIFTTAETGERVDIQSQDVQFKHPARHGFDISEESKRRYKPKAYALSLRTNYHDVKEQPTQLRDIASVNHLKSLRDDQEQRTRSAAEVGQSLRTKPDTANCRYHKRSFRILYVFGMFTLVVALIASAHTIFVNLQTEKRLQVLGEKTAAADGTGQVQTNSGDPSEDPVSHSDLLAYRVDTNAIRYIRVPSLHINARVKAAGLDSGGAVEAPKNIYDVNWYNGSVLPGGNAGTTLLVGHLSGWTAPGVFKRLDKVKSGELIELERGDGKKLRYIVEKIEKLPVENIDMGAVLASDATDKHVLKLMTCAGSYDRQSESFRERSIVYASLID